MIRNKHTLMGLGAILAAGLLVLGTGCTVDDTYKLDNFDKINTEVTLFEDGISIPVGSTNKISIGDLLSSEGESLDDFLKTNANGEYSIYFEDKTNLNKEIKDLNLADLASLNPVSVSQKFNFDIGGASAEKFSIPAREYSKTTKFTGYEFLDIKLDDISSDVDGLCIYAGLNKYKDIIDGNPDLDFGKSVSIPAQSFDVLNRTAVAPVIALSPSDDAAISVPASVIPAVNLPQTDVNFKVGPVSIHKDVNFIKQLSLDPNAKIVLTLKLANVFLTKGEAIPDVNIDFSSLFNIAGGSKINLKDLVLNEGNNFTASKAFSIEGLKKTEYGSTISIDENISLDGNINITSAETTKKYFNETSGDLKFEVSVDFQSLKIASAEVGINTLSSLEKDGTISLGDYSNIDLPKEVKDVKKIILDETKPFNLSITPKNLGILESTSIPYTIELEFPACMEVEGAVNGKRTFTGDLAKSAINETIVLKSISPTVKDGKIFFDGNINAKSTASAAGLSILTTKLPATEAEDVSFAVKIEGSPAIKDYQLTINEINQSAEMSESLDIDVSDIGDFGNFTVIPKGTPNISMQISLPKVAGIDIIPGAKGIVIQLPDVVKFDEKSIDPAFAFDAAANTVTIKNTIPASIDLPVKELDIRPVKEGDKSVVKSSIGVSGDVRIAESDLNQNDLKAILGSEFGVVINIPEIKAESITLDGDFSVNIDETYNMVILKKENFPSQLVSIDEAILDNTSLTVDAIFTGLGKGSFDVDLNLTMPEFVTPSVFPLKGKITDGKFSGTPVKIEKLSGLDLSTGKDIEGTIGITGTIKSSGATFNLSDLDSNVGIDLNLSISGSNGKIAISKATGRFKYDLDNTQTVSIGNIPEAFKGDGVCLDLANPQICLEMSSNLGIPITGSLEIIPVISGKEITANKILIDNVVLPYTANSASKDTKKYCICNTKADCAAGYEPLTANVSQLLKQIPEQLKISIKAAVDEKKAAVIEPKADYTFDIAYKLDVPLSFGSEFKFSTETKLDLSSAEALTSMGSFGLKGKAVNDSPIGLNITLSLLDEKGSVIPQSKPSAMSIAPASTSDIEFYLTPTDKTKKVKDANLTITVTAKPGVALKNTDSVQLIDLVAIAPEGLTISSK